MMPAMHDVVILAGGCFWGMQDLLCKQDGVITTRVGYCGGSKEHATYQCVKTGKTDHTEAVEITFDPKRISYQKILEFFFKIHDPTTKNRQGNDAGTQYRSAIFCKSEKQKTIAENLIKEIEESHKWPGKIVTQVVLKCDFYAAEDFHQDYLRNNPGGYTCHWVRPEWKA